jgi:hypothetical protein
MCRLCPKVAITIAGASATAIAMRLLAKNAEERYQTAAGLEADLRRCLAEWQSHGGIDPFPLGTDDSSDRLLIPEKLYGREREVEALLGRSTGWWRRAPPNLYWYPGIPVSANPLW